MEPDETTTTVTAAPVAVATDSPAGGSSGHPPVGDTTEPADDTVDATDDGLRQTFDRPYVEQLRRSEAGYRQRAKHADALGERLVTAYAAATGRLADATDLAYDAALCDDDGLPDPGKVTAAVDALLEAKPHLASRRPVGDVGQGARPGQDAGVSLAGLLRAGAG